MRRLDLEFQPRRSGVPAWSALVIVVALLAGVLTSLHLLQEEQVALETSLHRLEQRLGRRPVADVPQDSAASREQAERLAQMRQVSQQLQRPWEQLFAMLESLPQEDIALLSLSPDARKGQLRIAAQARSLEAMLHFHQRLESSGELRDVSLLDHEIVARQPEHPVQFNLSALWEVGHARP